jgi:hypothetical protein
MEVGEETVTGESGKQMKRKKERKKERKDAKK